MVHGITYHRFRYMYLPSAPTQYNGQLDFETPRKDKANTMPLRLASQVNDITRALKRWCLLQRKIEPQTACPSYEEMKNHILTTSWMHCFGERAKQSVKM